MIINLKNQLNEQQTTLRNLQQTQQLDFTRLQSNLQDKEQLVADLQQELRDSVRAIELLRQELDTVNLQRQNAENRLHSLQRQLDELNQDKLR